MELSSHKCTLDSQIRVRVHLQPWKSSAVWTWTSYILARVVPYALTRALAIPSHISANLEYRVLDPMPLLIIESGRVSRCAHSRMVHFQIRTERFSRATTFECPITLCTTHIQRPWPSAQSVVLTSFYTHHTLVLSKPSLVSQNHASHGVSDGYKVLRDTLFSGHSATYKQDHRKERSSMGKA